MLGLGGVFLVRFYVLSEVALFREITPNVLNIGTATLLIGNLVLAVSLARARLRRLSSPCPVRCSIAR